MNKTSLVFRSFLALVLAGLATTLTEAPGALAQDPPSHLPAHRPEVPGVQGLVTGGHPLASMAGARILLQGGNAVDATVAMGAVLNVVKPGSSGAGGNGFFTIYDRETDRVYSLNATGAAPLALEPETLTSDDLVRGMKAGIVPGTFGGWIVMLQRFGTMSLAEVLEPAIHYAEEGHPIDPLVARSIENLQEIFEAFPTSRDQFLPEGRAPRPWETFRMPDLARTFQNVVEAEQEALARGSSRTEGLRAAYDRFYRGDIAEEIDRFHREQGGLITLEDLDRYEPIWAEPVHTTYRGYDVYSSPSTSRGGYEVVMGLNLLEGYDLRSMGRYSAQTLHLIAEAIKVSKADIYRYIADPAFTDIPVSGLTSKDFASERRQLIDEGRAVPFPSYGTPGEVADDDRAQTWDPEQLQFSERTQDGSTDSYSVVDRWGNVVGATPTHGSGYGSAVVVGNTGLTFNNGMRVGSAAPYPDHINYPEPGKIPILNNAPTMVFRDGEFVTVFGTPGGEAIGQAQLQVAVNLLEFGMTMQESIEAPRLSLAADPNFYRTGAEITLRLENRITPEVVGRLRSMGHQVELIDGLAGGNMQGVLKNPSTGALTAGGDPRNLGYAIGF